MEYLILLCKTLLKKRTPYNGSHFSLALIEKRVFVETEAGGGGGNKLINDYTERSQFYDVR